MDIYNNIIDSISPILDKISVNVNEEQKVNVLICVYIILFMFIKPYKATEIAKMPIIQLSIIAYILYISNDNYQTATLCSIAFLITIMANHDNNEHSRNIPNIEIENREQFTGDDEMDLAEEYSNKNSDDESNQSDNSDEDDEQEDDSDGEDDDDEDDDEDSDDSDDEDDVNAKPPIKAKKKKNVKKNNKNRTVNKSRQIELKKSKKEKFKNALKEDFLSGNLLPKNSLNDTFKDLHVAIHKLENFISIPN
jgi:hypothetical protein